MALTIACGTIEKGSEGTAQRIVAVAPSVTEILYALGLGERVVGVGDYVTWPPEAAAKPRIGGLFDPRLEEIVTLRPDLAILLSSEGKLAAEIRRLGIEVLVVEHESLEDLESSIEAVAERAGVTEAGQRLVAELRSGIEPRLQASGSRTVLVVAREPGRLADLTVVGSGTFLAELLERTGAVNVFRDLEQPYAQVGLEEILGRRPEVVIELQPDALDSVARARLIAEWQRFPQIDAVTRDCVRVVSGSHVLLPGPRLPHLVRGFEEVLADCGRKT
jgi:iron complex transport system substrate-binding protein